MDGRRAEASSLLREETERTRDLRRQIDLDIRVSLDSLKSADLQVAAAREGLELAEKEYAHGDANFYSGTLSLLYIPSSYMPGGGSPAPRIVEDGGVDHRPDFPSDLALTGGTDKAVGTVHVEAALADLERRIQELRALVELQKE